MSIGFCSTGIVEEVAVLLMKWVLERFHCEEYYNLALILVFISVFQTVQTVATLIHIEQAHTRGPFLVLCAPLLAISLNQVVIPLSTISHWKREFEVSK